MILLRFWNNKLSGIPGAIYQFTPALYFNFMDKISTLIQLKNLGKKGKNNTIQCKTILRNPSNIYLENNINIGRGVSISTEIMSSTLTIGAYTAIDKKCHLDYTGNLEIGERCLFSEGVTIETHHHGSNPRNPPQPINLKIENNVWIGMNAMVLHNVTSIGKNSIIGACSVVTKNIPDNVIVAGNPAKIIRSINEN